MAGSGRTAPRNDRLAKAREQFLSTEQVDPEAVRHTILASWWRSRTWKVAADHIALPYVGEHNPESPLLRSAGPVLDRLQDQLNELAVSVILTDHTGLVLDRRTQDKQLERYLDRVQLARGFSYAEEFVGTNGIGTALESLQPTSVFGHEHYAENLDTLACAGVPIRHPVSRQVLGLLDLTCWRRDAGPLLLALAKTTTQDIEQELTTQVGIRELSLFAEYLRACRRGSGIVLAVSNDLVMFNEHARQVLSPEDQAALLTRAAELLSRRRDVTSVMDLPSGGRARLACTPVSSEAGPAGGVVRVRLVHELVASAAPARVPVLPGLVGSGALWLRACRSAGGLASERQWGVLEGEPGTGKLAIISAVHARYFPAQPLVVVDTAEGDLTELDNALPDERATVVLRHLDQLPADRAAALTTRLDGAGAWVLATVTGPGAGDAVLRHFPVSVPVPPLRHHVEDIRELVPFLLMRLGRGADLRCSAAAMQLLLRTNWPGNVAQLRDVLREVVRRHRSGVVEPEHLPPECRTTGGRVLNPLEAMERDAIVRSLLDAGGSKVKAAQALGVSRATIYRKIRDYGIDISR